jgi:hypothetical protein
VSNSLHSFAIGLNKHCVTILRYPNKVIHQTIDVMRISLKFHTVESINWKKTHFTLSSTGTSPRDLRYALKATKGGLSKDFLLRLPISEPPYFCMLFVQ